MVNKTPIRLTWDEAADSFPLWTHDSKRIIFLSDRNGDRRIYQKNADGSENVELFLDKKGRPLYLSEDGRTLLLIYSDSSGQVKAGILSKGEDQVIKPLLSEKYPGRFN